MKCYVLLVDRTKGILYKNAEYNANAGIIKKGLFKGTEGFFIPDGAITVDIDYGRRGSIPFWVVNARTGSALSLFEGDLKQTMQTMRAEPNTEPQTQQQPTPQRITATESSYSKAPKGRGLGGLISFIEQSDPATKFKLNVLTKTAFWEMLGKQMKISLIRTLIYMCAGGGIFLMGLYIIKVIFLKEASI